MWWKDSECVSYIQDERGSSRQDFLDVGMNRRSSGCSLGNMKQLLIPSLDPQS